MDIDDIKVITSKENSLFKEALSLHKRRYRRERGRILIEGEKLLRDCLAYGEFDSSDKIILEEGPRGAEILNRLITKGKNKGNFVFMEGKLFARLTQTESSQGVLAVVNKRMMTSSEFISYLENKDGNLLVLDRLQDPGNMGTLLRTAEATGYLGVIILKGTVDVFSLKVIRASAGSVMRIPIVEVENSFSACEIIKKLKKKIVVTDLNGQEYDTDFLLENIALVIGNEGSGIGTGFLDLRDFSLRLPMEGLIESLNAGVAGAIIMYSGYLKMKQIGDRHD